MSKSLPHVLIWSEQHQRYELHTHGHLVQAFLHEAAPAWQHWLTEHTAFAFVGRAGRLSVLKEGRSRGNGYWYAYRTQARQTRKRYLGPTAKVTFNRLEEEAQALSRDLNPAPFPLRLALHEQTALSAHRTPIEPEGIRSDAPPLPEQEGILRISKLSRPRLPTSVVERPRLLSALQAVRTHPLTLLSASAGSGKTTLLSAWVAGFLPSQESQETAKDKAQRGVDPLIAWLSLDELDNDPIRFWTSVIAALRTRLPHLGQRALAFLHSLESPQLSTMLLALLQEIMAEDCEIILILDDYQVISAPSIHETLHFLLDHLPANLHVVLATRADPELPLSRFRVRGHLIELRNRDLRFTQEEAAHFLTAGMGLPLSAEAVALLHQRTEGWIAGLQLAALALQKQEDRAAFVQGLTGSQRYLLDYVQEEILARLPITLQDFLLHSAILNRLSAALCQAVTGESNLRTSQELLERLERANLFLVPLDEERRWYRLHDLFREALLARLHTTQPELVPVLHHRAARWYEAQGWLDEAIPHALEAQDGLYAALLLERFIVPQSWRNEYHLLRRWLTRLPQEVLRARPNLCFMSVHAIIFTSPRPTALDLVEEPLSMAEQGFQTANNQTGVGGVITARAILNANQGNFIQAFALAQHALTLLPEDEQQWRGHCIALLGTEAATAGHLSRAQAFLWQAHALYERTSSLPGALVATAMLGDIALSQGVLHQAAQIFRLALATRHEQPELSQGQLTLATGARDRYYERLALYGLAALAYESNHLTEAEQAIQEAFSGEYHAWFYLLSSGLLLRVRLFCARGEFQQAQDFLYELSARALRPAVQRELQCCQAYLALKRGDLTLVQQWASSLQPDGVPLPLRRREEERLLLARLRIAEGQPHAALDLLANWRQEAHLETRRHSALQVLLLEAIAYEASGARAQAQAALVQACQEARVEGYQRLFLDEGARLVPVLKALVREPLEEALSVYLRTLLRAFAREATNRSPTSPHNASLLAEPLTPQERRVLGLLAEGVSNQAIAETLVISHATVKKHVANILSKLGAKNRTQAIALAQAYALL